VHKLLRIKLMKDFKHMNKSEWIAFLLSKSFANSQRYRNMIVRSIFRI
jgi:predicted DNA-binding protein (MmcQ/YjbR family)